jgi:putative cell wall-binding protein|tara:strand:+ start:257 stop:670 length:414 start_codon:yes stop_codon:yes gene_type:complete
MSKGNMENKFEKIFDLPDSKALVEIINESKPPKKEMSDTLQDDYDYARGNLRSIIDNGENVLQSLINIAQVSEHPRAFEVVSQLMKTMIDANKDLISLQKQVKDIKEDKSKQPTPQNVTNAMFVGNTKDLQKMLKEM